MYKYCVGVVPIPYLSAIVPYMPDHGVVRGSDSSIDSYIVPLSCIGLAEQHYYRGVIAMHMQERWRYASAQGGRHAVC